MLEAIRIYNLDIVSYFGFEISDFLAQRMCDLVPIEE